MSAAQAQARVESPAKRQAKHIRPIVAGTRGSALALWQTRHVLALLRERAPEIDVAIEEISTRGDRTQALRVPLTQLGDKSMFVAELEQALLAGGAGLHRRESGGNAGGDGEIIIPPATGRVQHTPTNGTARGGESTTRPEIEVNGQRITAIDMAVHSLKDLPGRLDTRLVIAAVPARADPRDAVISRHGVGLLALPPGATVATSSLRRRAQLLALRPDFQMLEMRGNVDTRVRKALAADGPDAIVLAAAGLQRLGLEGHITELLPVETMVPAVGQGALAVEIRVDDRPLRRLLARIEDMRTRLAVTAERAVLAELGGGCQVPMGAHATLSADDQTLRLLAVVASLDGTRLVRVEREGPASRPAALGRAVARELLRNGGRAILRELLGAA